MSSSTSSSDPAAWRRFFWGAIGTTGVVAAVIFLFVALTDPWDTLPLHWPAQRVPVTSNQRFAYPALARSQRFDSAIIGTSTSRLLRPAVLDPAFDARFVNLAMNDATVFEMAQIFGEFARSHRTPKVVAFGLDDRWCVTGDDYRKLTPRPFPAWMYGHSRWRGYGELLNLFAVQEAGKAFGVLTGIKAPDMGSDGYTRFTPPDDAYDHAKAQRKLSEYGLQIPSGPRQGPPTSWRFPALEVLQTMLDRLPPETLRLIYFVPFNRRMLLPSDHPDTAVWTECKQRVAAMAQASRNGLAVDFLLHSPITDNDDNHWDGMHTTVAAADRFALGLAAAARGEAGPDFHLLSAPQRP